MSDTTRIERLLNRVTKLAIWRWRHFAAVMFAVVVSMSCAVAQDAAADEQQSKPPESKAVLSGKIVDDSGAPVTDATINLMGKTRKPDGSTDYHTTKTDSEGRYAFDSVSQMDTYRLRIESTRCVGLNDWRALPELQLSPLSEMTRDFELQRACVVRIQVVNEQNKPVKGVRIYVAALSSERFRNSDASSTDEDGWATLGGLAPSQVQYIFGTSHSDYAFAKLTMKLDDPDQKYEEKIVLSRGVEVKGVAICSDGKPAVGWTVNAMPSWWHFGAHPRGMAIDNKGGFTLPHVAPGKYDVSVSVPTGEGMFRQQDVLADAQLPPSSGVLELNLPILSPKSMVAIIGTIKIEGQPLKESISISASSEDGQHRGHGSFEAGEREFRISPLPPGRYTLTFSSTGVEQVRLEGVEAPTDEVEVTLKSVGKPRLSGSVVRADTKEPLQHFRVRVLKVGYLRGPNYVQDSNWQTVDDPLGLFSLELVGPGIYQVVVDADGRAPTRSDRINTDEFDGAPLWLEMDEGVTLRGMVVDEQGNPIDGATVTAGSYATGPTAANEASTTAEDNSVQTVAGKFEIPNLPAGEEVLIIEHPDFCAATTEPFTVGTTDHELDSITLVEGGTIQGHVYDSSGKPEANVTLHVQDNYGYSGGGDRQAGRLATAVTDENGRYTARHLPEELCYVQRAEEWSSIGVVRTAVLPINGETSQVDLGGPEAATGRLLTNGEPLQNQRVQIAGDSPHFGVYKAYSQTDDDGNFTFWGPAPSKRVLYYCAPGTRSEWVRACEVQIDPEKPAADIFGEIDARAVTLSVPVTGVAEDELSKVRVSLQEYNPRWPTGNRVGVLQSRQQLTDPFVISRVPPGRYDLVCRHADNNLALRIQIDVSTEKSEQQIPVEWPAQTGTLEVRFDEDAFGLEAFSNAPNLWSTDGRVNATVYPREGNAVRYENLPAGDYYLADADIRNPPRVLEFSVAPGGEEILELTAENYQPPANKVGMLVVKCYTPDGVPLEGCDVELTSNSGTAYQSSNQYGRITMAGDPGDYTMTVTYPGYQPVEQQVTIKPLDADGRVTGDVTVQIRLQRAAGE
ncbi:carboxypeptidase regulatory-like domain-containing protein [Aeoliella sp.]|uniref:carboxypeptidase regulatory-like domain-containing protein n=1 Tax=Aeoliella sp. TaxID=2795800 RepID=UPI003CCB939C